MQNHGCNEEYSLLIEQPNDYDFEKVKINISRRKPYGSVFCIIFLIILSILVLFYLNTVSNSQEITLNKTNSIYYNNFVFSKLITPTFSLFIAIMFYFIIQLLEEYKNLKPLYDNSKKCAWDYFCTQNRHIIWFEIALLILLIGLNMCFVLLEWQDLFLYAALSLIIIYFTKGSRFETNIIAPEIWPNLGKSLALWYFHGYLKSILSVNFRERIIQYEDNHRVKIAVHKLFLLFPTSCFVKGNLEDEDPKGLECAQKLIELKLHGQREYNNTVYKLINERRYFLVTELASPLKTIWEMDKARSTIIQMAKEHRKTVFFDFYNSLQELLENDDSCLGNFVLVLYQKKNNGTITPLSEVLRNAIEKELLQ